MNASILSLSLSIVYSVLIGSCLYKNNILSNMKAMRMTEFFENYRFSYQTPSSSSSSFLLFLIESVFFLSFLPSFLFLSYTAHFLRLAAVIFKNLSAYLLLDLIGFLFVRINRSHTVCTFELQSEFKSSSFARLHLFEPAASSPLCFIFSSPSPFHVCVFRLIYSSTPPPTGYSNL